MLIKKISAAILKYLYRYSHTSRYRHNEKLWPHVNVTRNAAGMITRFTFSGRDFPLLNAQLSMGVEMGECHLLATGPSIRDIDYTALPMGNVMGVNGAIALLDRAPVRFTHYCIIDTSFVSNRTDLVERIIRQDLLLFTTPFCLWRMLQYFKVEQFRCRVFLIEDIRYRAGMPSQPLSQTLAGPAGKSLRVFDAALATGFSFDIRHGVFDAQTVVYTALQVAMWLGFQRMFIHGMDMHHTSTTPRFYETTANMQPSGIEYHFATLIEPAFRQASVLLRAHGVQVYNLAPRSAIDSAIFEKIDWRQLCAPVSQSSFESTQDSIAA